MAATVTGIPELLRKLDSLGADLREELETAGEYAMRTTVERDAKRFCPVDTGRLQGSITTAVVEDDTDSVLIATGTNVEYAEPVEFGHRTRASGSTATAISKYGGGMSAGGGMGFVPAQPYLRPAMDQNKEKVIEVLKSRLKRRAEALA